MAVSHTLYVGLQSKVHVQTSLQRIVLVKGEKPDDAVHKIKQRTAFPPNYVHSIDSTHMMMTAIACARAGTSPPPPPPHPPPAPLPMSCLEVVPAPVTGFICHLFDVMLGGMVPYVLRTFSLPLLHRILVSITHCPQGVSLLIAE